MVKRVIIICVILCILLLGVFSVLAYTEFISKNDYPAKKVTLAYEDSLIACTAQSAKELLGHEDQANKVYSPVNIYLALSMLSEITGGDTRSEILSVLNVENIETVRKHAKEIYESVREEGERTTSLPAASIWLRNDIQYKPDALEALVNDYFASSFEGVMGDPEFDLQLQSWLNENTGGLLEEQAKGLSFDEDTLIALAASLYFRAEWNDVFSESSTKTDVFHAVSSDRQAQFMHKGDSGTYYWDKKFGAVALPLSNGGKMWFILPNKGVSPESLFESDAILRLTNDPGAWKKQKHLIINKAIPKFDVTGENNLVESLQNLGVQLAFDITKSDFTPLTDFPDIYVSKAQHDVRVKIDEKGVEAAAYTVIIPVLGSTRFPEKSMDFIVDRPFAFVITSDDDLPLFAGVVNEVK